MRDTIRVVSLHDRKENGALAFDVKDILVCLGDSINDWKWYLREELDATGVPGTTETKDLHESMDRTKPHGIWISTASLRSFAENTLQVIDGTFVAFPVNRDEQTLADEDKDTRYFATNAMECVIRAFDSSEFIVFLKRESLVKRIVQRFNDVREEEKESFFRR